MLKTLSLNGLMNMDPAARGLVPDYHVEPDDFPLRLVFKGLVFLLDNPTPDNRFDLESNIEGICGLSNMDQGEFIYQLLNSTGVTLRSYSTGSERCHLHIHGTVEQLRAAQVWLTSDEPELISLLLRGREINPDRERPGLGSPVIYPEV